SGKIQGQVVLPDGVTPGPASVVTVQVGGLGGNSQSTATDNTGNFSFDVVPEGLATLSATVLNSIDRGQSTVDGTAGSTLHPSLPVNGVGSISGRTENDLGSPIPGHLTVTGTGAFPYTFVLDTGSDGLFNLPQVLAGNFTATLNVLSGTIQTSGSVFSSVAPN